MNNQGVRTFKDSVKRGNALPFVSGGVEKVRIDLTRVVNGDLLVATLRQMLS